jgi:tetrahydromethanopterin S-methyltransferase subunit F
VEQNRTWGTVRRGRTVHGGTSSRTIELAIGTLIIIVLVVVLLRLLGLL